MNQIRRRPSRLIAYFLRIGARLTGLRPGMFSALLVFLLITSSISAEPNFKIEDYKPVRLVDFEWRITPEINFGDRSATATISRRDAISNIYLSGPSSHIGGFGSTSLDYFNYNLSRTISVFASQSIAYSNNQSTGGSAFRPFISLSQHHYESETEGTSLFSHFDVRIDKYIGNDLFLSFQSLGTFRFRGRDDEFDNEQFSESVTSRSLTTTRQAYDSKSEDVDFEISAGVGYGRTYIGRYSYLCWYILNELEDASIITGQVSLEEFQEMSQMLYELKEVHTVDSRIRRIDAVTRITEFLLDKNAIRLPSLMSQAIIADAWDFAPGDTRLYGWKIAGEAGFQFFQGINTSHSITFRRSELDQLDSLGNVTNSSVTIDTTETFSKRYQRSGAPFLRTDFEYLKPLSMRTHLNISSRATYFFDRTDISNTATNSDRTLSHTDIHNQYEFKAIASINRIISSRTRLDYSLQFEQVKFRMTKESASFNPLGVQTVLNRTKAFKQTLTLAATINYRIAIPTTLIVRSSAIYDNSDIEFETTSFSESGMNYSLTVRISSFIY